MALEPLAQAVESILLSEDFETEYREGYILATKGSLSIALCIPPPREDPLQALADFEVVDLPEETFKVLVTQKEPDEETAHIAKAKGIVIWTRDNVEEERGISILRKYIKDPPSGLVKRITEGGARPVSIEVGLAPKGVVITESVNERYLPVNMDLAHVRELADKNINGFSFNLELVPYYVFRALHGEKEAYLAVNGIDSTVEEWDEPLHFLRESKQHHTRLEPNVPHEDATEIAMEKALHRFSEHVEKMVKKGHMTIIQKEDRLPEPGEVALKGLGLVFRPLWCVEGVHGVMIVDAFTRKIIEMDYYKDPSG